MFRLPYPRGFSSLLPWALGSLTPGPRSGLTTPTANQPHKLHPTSSGPRAGGMDFGCQTQAGSGTLCGTHRENGGGEALWWPALKPEGWGGQDYSSQSRLVLPGHQPRNYITSAKFKGQHSAFSRHGGMGKGGGGGMDSCPHLRHRLRTWAR